MFIAFAKGNGWEVYRSGNPVKVAEFAKLATVKETVASMGGVLAVVINGIQVN